MIIAFILGWWVGYVMATTRVIDEPPEPPDDPAMMEYQRELYQQATDGRRGR